jgi:iron complex transport system substrate-binding protein
MHECDYPAGVEVLPILTSATIGPLPTSKGIDSAVRDVLKDALAIYEIDVEKLREVRPDVIVTQDLCDVCAVSLDDVRAAVSHLARNDVRIVNLHPTRLDGIWADIERVAEAIGRTEAGRRAVRDLRERIAEIGRRALQTSRRPTVLTVEWIDP